VICDTCVCDEKGANLAWELSPFRNAYVLDPGRTEDQVDMTEPSKFTLYLFRYVDNVVSGEFVNLAIALVENSDSLDRFVGFKVMKDWARLKQFFPRADVDNLRSWCNNLSNEIKRAECSADLLATLENASTNIDLKVESHAVLSHKATEAELTSLATSYLH
jgi:hypothetical protein